MIRVLEWNTELLKQNSQTLFFVNLIYFIKLSWHKLCCILLRSVLWRITAHYYLWKNDCVIVIFLNLNVIFTKIVIFYTGSKSVWQWGSWRRQEGRQGVELMKNISRLVFKCSCLPLQLIFVLNSNFVVLCQYKTVSNMFDQIRFELQK